MLPRVPHHRRGVALPLLTEEFEDIEDVDARNQIQHLSTAMFPLALDEVRPEGQRASARCKPPFHSQQRDDVRIRLRHDEVIAVEEFAQVVHGQIRLETTIAPASRSEFSFWEPRHEGAAARFCQQWLRREQRGKRARRRDG